MRFGKLIVCLDMAGCPNRCRHCWLGATPNGKMATEELRFAAEAFRPFADKLEVLSWYREPDYREDYQALWALEEQLSDEKTPHFELMSLWRAVRDEKYVPWLREMGVGHVQLTLFGGREMTDRYYGRTGAYDELMQAVGILLRNGITPRFQAFVNQENIDQMHCVEELADELHLTERSDFCAFVHQGSCDGENAKLYPMRITPAEAERIPKRLRVWTQDYFGKNILEVLGQTEAELCRELKHHAQPIGMEEENTLVLYVDKDFYVYPNITSPAPAWRLGNLKADGAQSVLRAYAQNASLGQRIRTQTPVSELVRTCGDADSLRLFTKEDYLDALNNTYAQRAGA